MDGRPDHHGHLAKAEKGCFGRRRICKRLSADAWRL
jgi:hypothetical protein